MRTSSTDDTEPPRDIIIALHSTKSLRVEDLLPLSNWRSTTYHLTAFLERTQFHSHLKTMQSEQRENVELEFLLRDQMKLHLLIQNGVLMASERRKIHRDDRTFMTGFPVSEISEKSSMHGVPFGLDRLEHAHVCATHHYKVDQRLDYRIQYVGCFMTKSRLSYM